MEPPPASPAAPAGPPDPPLFVDPPPMKLRVGVKAPPPSAPPAGAGASALPDDLFPPMAPLVPLPGLPPMGGPPPASGPGPGAGAFGGAGGGVSFPRPGSTPPPLPPPTSPPPGFRPPGTAEIGSGPIGSGAGATPAYSLAGANAPLMPLSVAGGTRPPMPLGAAPAAAAGSKTQPKRPGPKRDLMIFLLLFLLLVAGGVGAYFYFTQPQLANEALQGVKEKLEKAAELPGKAVDNAKENMANARNAEQERMDKIASGEALPEDRALNFRTPDEISEKLNESASSGGAAKPAPASNAAPKTNTPPKPNVVISEPPKPATGATEAYGGAQTQEAEAAPAASARFVRYAEGLSVSGVFQGSPPRALIDGRIIRAGDVIEPMLGVSFVGVDAEKKFLILEDGTGAQVRVKY